MNSFDLDNWKEKVIHICNGQEPARITGMKAMFWKGSQESLYSDNKEEWICGLLEVYNSYFIKRTEELHRVHADNYIPFLFDFCDLLYQDSCVFTEITSLLEEQFPGELIDHQYEKGKMVYDGIEKALGAALNTPYIGEEIDTGLQAYLFCQKYEQIRQAPIQFKTSPRIEDYYGSLMLRHMDRVSTDEGKQQYLTLLPLRKNQI